MSMWRPVGKGQNIRREIRCWQVRSFFEEVLFSFLRSILDLARAVIFEKDDFVFYYLLFLVTM